MCALVSQKPHDRHVCVIDGGKLYGIRVWRAVVELRSYYCSRTVCALKMEAEGISKYFTVHTAVILQETLTLKRHSCENSSSCLFVKKVFQKRLEVLKIDYSWGVNVGFALRLDYTVVHKIRLQFTLA